MTVKELYGACKHLVDTGYGDKMVLISDDTRGTGYHNLPYGFTVHMDELAALELHDKLDTKHSINEIVVLG